MLVGVLALVLVLIVVQRVARCRSSRSDSIRAWSPRTWPFLALFGLLLHANVTWSFGPLRYVIASPAFHRWHHSSEEAGLDRNFAGLFPIWDLLFRTFLVPAHAPRVFGVGDAIPDGFVGQMAWPFQPVRRLRHASNQARVRRDAYASPAHDSTRTPHRLPSRLR